MKKTVTEDYFMDELRSMYHEEFTTEGAAAIYNHIIELEEHTGDEFDLDDLEDIKDNYKEYVSIDDLASAYLSICEDLEAQGIDPANPYQKISKDKLQDQLYKYFTFVTILPNNHVVIEAE